MQISSVSQVHCDQAFWNDSFTLKDISDSLKCINIEIHNYTLFENESDLYDPSFGESDFIGKGLIDFSQLCSS